MLQKICSKIRNLFLPLFVKTSTLTNALGGEPAASYSDLTPTTDCDQQLVYCHALKWALQNPEIRNIALSGPYGSGKSSILKKFKEENQIADRCIEISLAALLPATGDGPTFEKELIEMSILQQIFYCERARRIPDSRFRRIKLLSSGRLSLWAIGLMLWVLICQAPFWFPDIHPRERLWWFIGWVTLSGLGLGHFSAKLMRAINGGKVSRLNIKNGEIELSQGTDPSILNKYLDEILYFFEATKYDVVIIEDLDRFDDPDLFTKLLEVNRLLNNSRQIRRRIVFIYALRDDLFQDKNRTKFFDFIIPVVNPMNANDVLGPKLSGTGVSPHLIDDISLYIDDMRLLKNICNEFFIYKGNLISENLTSDRIFAMIVYKNLFPEDFAALHIRQGIVYRAFERKPELAQRLNKGIERKITDLSHNLKEIQDLQLINAKELRAVYVEKIRDHLLDAATALLLNGEKITFTALRENGFPDALINASQIEYYYPSPYNGFKINISSVSFQDIERKVNPDMSYQEREKLLVAKSTEQMDAIKTSIEHLIAQKEEIQSWSLQQLLNEIEDVSIEEQNNPKVSLIVYLLRNGYITEDYRYYISLFHEGRLTRADYDFLLSIKNRRSLAFNYPLNRIENLLPRIRLVEFGYKETLNLSLTDHLLTACSGWDERVSMYFGQLSDESSTSLQYIDHYLTIGAQKPKFVARLAKKWLRWGEFIENHIQQEPRQESHLLLLLRYADIEDLSVQDKNHPISRYILSRRDFLNWVEWRYTDDPWQRLTDPIDLDSLTQRANYYGRIKSVIDRLELRFTALDAPQGLSPVLDHIYENGCYELTPEMITLFVQTKGKDIQVEDLQTAHYSTILASGCTPLIDRVEENIETYIDEVFLPLETNTRETQEAVVRLLNNETVIDKQKREIIQKEMTRLDDMTAVSDQTLWAELLRRDRVQSTWGNVVAYYEYTENIFDDYLVEFLNQPGNYTELSLTKFDEEVEMEEKFKESISLAIIENTELLLDSYTALLSSIPFSCAQWDKADIENLSEEKIDVLLEKGFLALTTENYDLLKEHFTPKHIALLEYHAAQSDSFVERFEFDGEDLLRMLLSDDFSCLQKVQFIHAVNEDLIIERRAICVLAARLLYETQDQSELSFTLLEHLVRNAADPEQKVRLMLWHWDIVQDKNRITALLQACGSSYCKLTQKGKRPAFPPTSYNYMLAEQLKAVGYISSYSEEKNVIRMNTKQR